MFAKKCQEWLRKHFEDSLSDKELQVMRKKGYSSEVIRKFSKDGNLSEFLEYHQRLYQLDTTENLQKEPIQSRNSENKVKRSSDSSSSSNHQPSPQPVGTYY